MRRRAGRRRASVARVGRVTFAVRACGERVNRDREACTHADAKDKAFWERVCPVTFRLRFVDSPLAPQERKRERGLAEELEVEASGILAWLVRGCLQWQRQGLRIPQSVLNERGLYREEEDTLQHFIADCCLLAPGAQVQSGRLYERYKQWAEDNNIGKKLTGTAFGLEMKRMFQQQRNNWVYLIRQRARPCKIL